MKRVAGLALIGVLLTPAFAEARPRGRPGAAIQDRYEDDLSLHFDEEVAAKRAAAEGKPPPPKGKNGHARRNRPMEAPTNDFSKHFDEEVARNRAANKERK